MTAASKIRTPSLDIAAELSGPETGAAVVLLHGFPYDVRSFDGVVGILAAAGCRTIVPYLRGYGPTHFLSADTPRSGEQAAIGVDLRDLLDALHVEQAILAGYDWGARAANVVAALWPARVRGLVSCCGYQIQDLAKAQLPVDPLQEYRFWYQHYFQTERGRQGLAANRSQLCRLLWKLWSPSWQFDDATYQNSARSFGNPDFVDVAIHSYRHRMGYAAGDPRYADIELQLAKLPSIDVPTIVLHGADDGVNPVELSAGHNKRFTARYERRVLAGVGHNPPQEAPAEFARAVLDLMA